MDAAVKTAAYLRIDFLISLWSLPLPSDAGDASFLYPFREGERRGSVGCLPSTYSSCIKAYW